ncbi:hypothetical protein QOT17_006661 [Balamuthia mandrillaris]
MPSAAEVGNESDEEDIFGEEDRWYTWHDCCYSCHRDGGKRLLYDVILLLKALAATLGGVIFWVGCWNLLDVYLLPQNLWSELGCVVVGALVLIATKSFTQHAGVTVPLIPFQYVKVESDGRIRVAWTRVWKKKILLYVRSFLALLGSVIMWKGVYNIFDIYLMNDTLYRSLTYFFVGIILLTATDTLSSNVGLSPISLNVTMPFLRSKQKKNAQGSKPTEGNSSSTHTSSSSSPSSSSSGDESTAATDKL